MLPTPATATAAAALSAATTTTAAASGAFRLGARFVHVQRASADLRSVQSSDRFLSVFGARHLDETKAARTACVPVGEDADTIHLAVHFEQLTQFVLRCIEIQVSHKDVLQASASGVSYLSVGYFGRKAGGT
jgi:hypothetical protein